MTDAKDCPGNDREDPKGGKVEKYTAVTVPAKYDTRTLFASPRIKKLFKIMLKPRKVNMES